MGGRYWNLSERISIFPPGVTNCIGVLLGNGWYSQDQSISPSYPQPTYGPPRLFVSLSLVYSPWILDVIVSDESWSGREGPHTYDSVYHGEVWMEGREGGREGEGERENDLMKENEFSKYSSLSFPSLLFHAFSSSHLFSSFFPLFLHSPQTYDSRRESPGWSMANFTDSLYAWVPAQILPPPGALCSHTHSLTLFVLNFPEGGELIPQSFPPIRKQMSLKHTGSWGPALNVNVFDFGQNMAGILKVCTYTHKERETKRRGGP